MNKATNILIVVILVAAVCGVIIYKHNKNSDSSTTDTQINININPQKINESESQDSKTLPRLVDIGAGTCIPCKMMAPILEELKTEYAGRLKVDFIDVWENPDAGKGYGIRIIPTQIFYDASSKELFRHEGFFSKADILTKWKELGIDIESKQE